MSDWPEPAELQQALGYPPGIKYRSPRGRFASRRTPRITIWLRFGDVRVITAGPFPTDHLIGRGRKSSWSGAFLTKALAWPGGKDGGRFDQQGEAGAADHADGRALGDGAGDRLGAPGLVAEIDLPVRVERLERHALRTDQQVSPALLE